MVDRPDIQHLDRLIAAAPLYLRICDPCRFGDHDLCWVDACEGKCRCGVAGHAVADLSKLAAENP